jgi:hypothetical protein
MKKSLFIIIMMLGSLSANAQFTVYRPYNAPSTSYNPSPGYGIPFSTYEPLPNYQQQPERPRMQQFTLKGYYKKGDDWYYTPIRVGVVGDEVSILSAKTQYGWINCGATANDVGAWDAEEIRDNFNYKVYTTIYGIIYF